MRFVNKALAAVTQKAVTMHKETVGWMERNPALWEYLTVEVWETGEVRERSMLCCFYEDGAFKVVLQDRENDRSMWVTGPSIEACIELLDSKLAQGLDTDWRAAKAKSKGFKKK